MLFQAYAQVPGWPFDASTTVMGALTVPAQPRPPQKMPLRWNSATRGSTCVICTAKGVLSLGPAVQLRTRTRTWYVATAV